MENGMRASAATRMPKRARTEDIPTTLCPPISQPLQPSITNTSRMMDPNHIQQQHTTEFLVQQHQQHQQHQQQQHPDSTPPMLQPIHPPISNFSAMSPSCNRSIPSHIPTSVPSNKTNTSPDQPSSLIYNMTHPLPNPGRAHRFCQACDHVNHVRRKLCTNCGTPKPSAVRNAVGVSNISRGDGSDRPDERVYDPYSYAAARGLPYPPNPNIASLNRSIPNGLLPSPTDRHGKDDGKPDTLSHGAQRLEMQHAGDDIALPVHAQQRHANLYGGGVPGGNPMQVSVNPTNGMGLGMGLSGIGLGIGVPDSNVNRMRQIPTPLNESLINLNNNAAANRTSYSSTGQKLFTLTSTGTNDRDIVSLPSMAGDLRNLPLDKPSDPNMNSNHEFDQRFGNGNRRNLFPPVRMMEKNLNSSHIGNTSQHVNNVGHNQLQQHHSQGGTSQGIQIHMNSNHNNVNNNGIGNGGNNHASNYNNQNRVQPGQMNHQSRQQVQGSQHVSQAQQHHSNNHGNTSNGQYQEGGLEGHGPSGYSGYMNSQELFGGGDDSNNRNNGKLGEWNEYRKPTIGSDRMMQPFAEGLKSTRDDTTGNNMVRMTSGVVMDRDSVAAAAAVTGEIRRSSVEGEPHVDESRQADDNRFGIGNMISQHHQNNRTDQH